MNGKQNGKDLAYEEIKSMILSGQLAAGTITSISELISTLNMGRSPVRDAILRLDDEGLLQVVPRKGILVSSINSKDIKEMFQLRLAIEFFALENIIHHATDEDLKALEEIICRQEEAAKSGREEAFPALDEDFHFYLINRLHNSRITAILDESRRQMSLYGYKGITAHGDVLESMEEHRNIYQAILNRDIPGGKRELEQHLLKAQTCVLLG